MMNQDNILSFVNFNYTPFSRKQCIIRLFVTWLLSGLCLVGSGKLISLFFVAFFDLLIGVVFGVLIVRFPKEKISRFICDGLTFLYASIILNVFSYKLIALNFGDNIALLLVFALLLLMCILLSFWLVLRNIKADEYKTNKVIKSIFAFSMLGAVSGWIFAKCVLGDISQSDAVLLVSVLLLFISLLLSIGSMSLLKVCFLKYLSEPEDDSK